jgi:Domain of unknown function DUF29
LAAGSAIVEDRLMRIIFVNNDGGGLVERPDISEGSTIGGFFIEKMGQNAQPSRYCVGVQRSGKGNLYVPVQDVTPNFVLQEGDRISFSPAKQTGAGGRRLKGQGVKVRDKFRKVRRTLWEHLLKIEYVNDIQSYDLRGWQTTVGQCLEILRPFSGNPSEFEEREFAKQYSKVVEKLSVNTDLTWKTSFPQDPPYTLAEVFQMQENGEFSKKSNTTS